MTLSTCDLRLKQTTKENEERQPPNEQLNKRPFVTKQTAQNLRKLTDRESLHLLAATAGSLAHKSGVNPGQ